MSKNLSNFAEVMKAQHSEITLNSLSDNLVLGTKHSDLNSWRIKYEQRIRN